MLSQRPRLSLLHAMFKRLNHSTIALAASPQAPWYRSPPSPSPKLSFFPIPPDIVLVPMALAQPKRAWTYATICTLASVTGGMLGYAIGALLYDTVGLWLIELYHYGVKFDSLRAFYQQWGGLFILVKGLLPIPYKLVTIITGLLGYNFGLFVLLSLITRGTRFFIVAGLVSRFGDPIKAALERHFTIIVILFLALIVVGFWLALHLF